MERGVLCVIWLLRQVDWSIAAFISEEELVIIIENNPGGFLLFKD